MARHVPTDEQRKNVKGLIGFGASLELIADTIGIEVETLKRAYEKELKMGGEHVKLDLVRTLFNLTKEPDSAGRTTAIVRLLDYLESGAKAEADKAKANFEPKLNELPQREMFFLEGCNAPVELFTADDKPAPALYYRRPSPTECHPGDTCCTRNDNCNHHDPRGYKLVQLYPRTYYNVCLFDKDGRPYEPVAMQWGDQWP